MIEVVSTQVDVEVDAHRNTSHYLELYGETRPALASNYAQVLPAGSVDSGAETAQVTPIYEYWWTIGHELDIYYENATRLLGRGPYHSHGFWENLGDVDGAAARVYLYFPVNGNWRIKELTATLKYLSPAPEQRNWLHDLLGHWQRATPLLQDASNIAGLIPTPATAATAEGLERVMNFEGG